MKKGLIGRLSDFLLGGEEEEEGEKQVDSGTENEQKEEEETLSWLEAAEFKEQFPALAAFYKSTRKQSKHKKQDNTAKRMEEEVPEAEMHGHLGVGKGWASPLLVTYCEEEARPGYKSMKAHEYVDEPATLNLKIATLARLLRSAQHCVAYTGAGISTSSGINDYASKSAASKATGKEAVGRQRSSGGLDAEPTFAHYTLAALHRAGCLKHWVQQNHDGLPQKAGFPQHAINEIHGAWFDPSNPVVPMSGSLRTDLFNWMLEEEQAADLTLTMGTSLCGMNADRMVSTPAKKAVRKGQGLGSVIIGYQRTQLDRLASLRIFGNIDQVMFLLALHMRLDVRVQPYRPKVLEEALVEGQPHVFRVPYATKSQNGKRLKEGSTPQLWDLSVGAKLKLTGGPGAGFEGTVVRTPDMEGARDYSYSVKFPCTREGAALGKFEQVYALGTWFIEAACKGELSQLPVINR